jgi:aspartate/methionine/tyrosine aminotransferase
VQWFTSSETSHSSHGVGADHVVNAVALNSVIVHTARILGPAPAPLQEGCAAGLESLGAEYYESLCEDYRERRDVLYDALISAGFACAKPAGAYYILADFSGISDLDDHTFARRLAREVGVAPVPGSSFFSEPERGRQLVRFAFCKRLETLEDAGRRLQDVSRLF